jgi:threonine dehydrogenase-like Zn-dependent dehydrogenase
MRALVLEDTVRLRTDVAAPDRPAGEALVRVRLAGVCDTDLQLARGYMNYRGVLGHEMVGEVVEHDDAAWIGRRVVSDINAGCGHCEDCTRRDGHHCASRMVLGIVGRSGALAEMLTMPARCLVPVPDAVVDESAVFAEPLAAALHVLDEIPRGVTMRVNVLGDGKLGLLIALALRGEGHDVLLVGHHAHKMAIAERAGARVRLEGEVDEARDRAPLVVEATGSANGLAAAMRLTEPRGTVILKTTVAGPLSIDLSPAVIHELRLVGSRCGDLKRAVFAMARGRVDPRPLIEAVLPLTRGEAAMERAARKGALKILVDPRA